MPARLRQFCLFCFLAVLPTARLACALAAGSWNGLLQDDKGNPVGEGTVHLHSTGGGPDYKATTSAGGRFAFPAISAGRYEVSVEVQKQAWTMADPLVIQGGTTLASGLRLSVQNHELRVVPGEESPQASSSSSRSMCPVERAPTTAALARWDATHSAGLDSIITTSP